MSKTKKSSQSTGNLPTAETLGDALGSQLPAKRALGSGMIAALSAQSASGTKIKRLTLPPIIPPSQVSLGIAVEGTVMRVVPSPKAQYKSDLLVMRHPSGQEFCWPVNAVTIGALATAQGVKRDACDLQKSVGLHLIIKGLGAKPMEGKDSEGKSRIVNLYEIFVVED